MDAPSEEACSLHHTTPSTVLETTLLCPIREPALPPHNRLEVPVAQSLGLKATATAS